MGSSLTDILKMGMVSGVLDCLAETGRNDCRGWKEAAWLAEGLVGEGSADP